MKVAQTHNNNESVHHGLADRENKPFFQGKSESEKPFFISTSVQPKIKIGLPNDKYEQQADRVADAVVSSTVPNIQQQSMEVDRKLVQMKCSGCEEEEKLQMKTGILQNNPYASPEISKRIENSGGGGSKLPPQINNEMSNKIGADFSGVNIHTGSKATELNQLLGARAFTHGNDIYFNSGEYRPGTLDGKHLLAHELTHVVQQNSDTMKIIQMQFQECMNLLNSQSLMSVISGNAAHAAIAAEFAIQVPGATSISIPGGSASPLRSQGICGRDSTIINPQLIGGRAGMGFPDLARIIGSTLEIAEIKPAAYECLIDGEEQLARYISNSNADDVIARSWRASNGISLVTPMSPSTFSPVDIITRNVTIRFAWCSPGLLVYDVIVNRTDPLPHRVPVRETDVVTDSKWQRIREFVYELIESGVEVEEAVRSFLIENRDLINLVIAAGIGLIVATLAQTIATAGVGIIQDFIIIPIAATFIRVAHSLRYLVPAGTAISPMITR
ncbi:MAG: DUF4157 domain-containing protein [Balneolaceae bacterium]|nr:MAG: DUF4157 domain-containing protein [Balneolaceae bacterium]